MADTSSKHIQTQTDHRPNDAYTKPAYSYGDLIISQASTSTPTPDMTIMSVSVSPKDTTLSITFNPDETKRREIRRRIKNILAK